MANKKKNKKDEKKDDKKDENNPNLKVKCLICEDIIEISNGSMSLLLSHIHDKHPELEKQISGAKVSNTLDTHSEKEQQNQDVFPPRHKMEDVTIRNGQNGKNLYTRRYRVATNFEAESPRKRRLYRTSIEKWRPGTGTIYCPKCGANKKPIIRTRTEKFSYNSCGAACILSCWPFCFLPFLFPMPPKEYLHCSNCQNFLGLYDREAETIRPNREFVETNMKCDAPPPGMSPTDQAPPGQDVDHYEKITGFDHYEKRSPIRKESEQPEKRPSKSEQVIDHLEKIPL